MFHVVNAESADEAYSIASKLFLAGGPARTQESRLGRTLEVPRVAFSISDPRKRYTFARSPAINPAFAIAEVVWIMTGRNDSAFLNYFNRALPKFAGESPTYHGAYGKRLRSGFGVDQLARAAETLRSKKESRQVVLQIWDANADLPLSCGTPVSCDVPCNVTSMLKIRDNRLEWTQILRSNDLFRGVPYNFIQFMTMHEILAGWIGVDPGCYCHLSDSLHVYESDLAAFDSVRTKTPNWSTTNFNLPFDDTMASLNSLAAHVDELICSSTSRFDFAKIIDASRLPICYRDMLCILFAEAARRRDDHDLVEVIMKRCECEALRLLMNNWLERLQANITRVHV
jgi:thymidylate synthase